MKKLQRSIQAILTITILWGAVLTGCQNPLAPPPQTTEQAEPGYGKVSISLGDEIEKVIEDDSRTVYPGRSGLTFVYTFTKAGGEPQTLTPAGGSFTLEYGQWTVVVKAYAGTENLAAQGTETFTVDTAAQTVVVELAGIDDTGAGIFSCRIQYPAGVRVSVFTVEKWPEQTPLTLDYSPTTSGGVTTIARTAPSVPAGFYFVTLRLVKDGRYAGRNEVVHIYDKLTSEFGSDSAPIVFTDEDFNAIPLAGGVWVDGNFTSTNPENWYSFTATADTQYIHVGFDTLSGGVYVQLYDSAGEPAGSSTRLHNGVLSLSRSLTSGEAYTIKVTPYAAFHTGTYQITFNAAGSPPAIILPGTATPLTFNTWASGEFSGSNTVNWYSFTATAGTQFIHVGNFGGTGAYVLRNDGVYVQLYDSAGVAAGSPTHLYSTSLSLSRTLTSNQVYYIKVTQDAGLSGTYQIAFNANFSPPGTMALTIDTWENFELADFEDVSYFSFTATAAIHFIHIDDFSGVVNPTAVEVNLYDSAGAAVHSSLEYSISAFRELTIGQVYHIRLTYSIGGLGPRQIAFSASVAPPGTQVLTADTWASGSFDWLPAGLPEKWYRFTATASEQYIHVNFGTLASSDGVTVRVFDSANEPVAVGSHLYDNDLRFSRTLTADHVYYIRVIPYADPLDFHYPGTFGTYQIAFNANKDTPIMPLTPNTWANGRLSSDGVNWYRFTATAATQYIHVGNFSTTDFATYGVTVTVSDGDYIPVGVQQARLNSSTLYLSRPLTGGQEYIIRVMPYTTSYTGAYQIGFTASIAPPGTQVLTAANTWADGRLSSSNTVNWYRFIASAATQYIHVGNFSPTGFADFGVNVQLLDSAGATVGSNTRLYSGTSFSSSLTSGNMYYIKVTPYNASYTGAYQVLFSGSGMPPGITSTTLTTDTPVEGSLSSGALVNWYSFTATTATQYIHVSFGSLLFSDGVNVQLYDSSGNMADSQRTLNGSNPSLSVTKTSGQYYARVTPCNVSSTGTYVILLNTSVIPPGITPATLAADTWTNGTLSSSNGVHWYSFTANAATQYIHVDFNSNMSSSSGVYIQVYDTSGGPKGSEERWRSPSNLFRTRSLSNGQTYYIRVAAYGNYGSYRIGYNTAVLPPSTTPVSLTANTWSGNVYIYPRSSSGWYNSWVKRYSFTGTGAAQYIHVDVDFDTMLGLYVQVYDSAGASVLSSTALSSTTTYVSVSSSNGTPYYVMVWPSSESSSYGRCRIGLSAGFGPPGTKAIPNGDRYISSGPVYSGDDDQWYSFTANVATQYIHCSLGGSIDSLTFQLYTSAGIKQGSLGTLSYSTPYASRTGLTANATYYIQVTPTGGSGGYYEIGYSQNTTAPWN
jgi:hypothetical protein